MPYDENYEQKIAKFLRKQAELESSGGQNVDHPPVESGKLAGHTAIGTFGLMPTTVKYISSLRNKMHEPDPYHLNRLDQEDNEDIKYTLEDSDSKQYDLARILALHLLNKYNGDEVKATAAWEGYKPNKIKNLDTLPRVQRFKALENKELPSLQDDNGIPYEIPQLEEESTYYKKPVDYNKESLPMADYNTDKFKKLLKAMGVGVKRAIV